MVSMQELSEEIRKVERRSRDRSQLQEWQTDETVGTTIAIMMDELDNLEPDETSNLERNVLKKHLGRLLKVATFSNRIMKGLREEVKEKNELIKTLQETVKQMLEKNDLKKGTISSPAPGTPPSICKLCADYAETKRQAQLLQEALQSLNTHIIDLMKNNTSTGTSARSSRFNTPRQLRSELDRPFFIWDRETVRKLEQYPKLTKDKEILHRKLDETKLLLAASECQRGGAMVTVDRLMSEVRRAKERIRVLEFKRSRAKAKRGGGRLPRNEAMTSKREVDQNTGKRIPERQRTIIQKAQQTDKTTLLVGNENDKTDRKEGQIAWKLVGQSPMRLSPIELPTM